MSNEQRAAFAIERIRQVLGDDKNYPDPVLKLGGIWSLCVRAAEYHCGASGDGSPYVEVRMRSSTQETGANDVSAT